MSILLFLAILLNINSTKAQSQLNYSTYGNPDDPAVLFLHGGPGYNSVVFEKTTADKLALNGLYVISYDRRGEGRSDSLPATYTFEETVTDIRVILAKENLDEVSLIGHSFGGVVAVEFAKSHPELTKTIFLISSPISMQETLSNIVRRSREIYENKKDTQNLYYIGLLEKMDTETLEYSTYSFMHAMNNGFYQTQNPNSRAKELYGKFTTDPDLKAYASKMDTKSPREFWKNESYTTIDLSEDLKSLKGLVSIYAIYGKDDGLFNKEIIENLQEKIGKEKVKYLDNASHSVFIDRQEKFVELVLKWLNT